MRGSGGALGTSYQGWLAFVPVRHAGRGTDAAPHFQTTASPIGFSFAHRWSTHTTRALTRYSQWMPSMRFLTAASLFLFLRCGYGQAECPLLCKNGGACELLQDEVDSLIGEWRCSCPIAWTGDDCSISCLQGPDGSSKCDHDSADEAMFDRLSSGFEKRELQSDAPSLAPSSSPSVGYVTMTLLGERSVPQ